MNTMRCKHLILHIADKLQHICCRSSADVHHKTGVLFGNLRTADSVAFKTCLVDKCTGEISGRTLEHTACTGQLQRLLSDAAITEICHFIGNSLLITCSQAHSYRSNNFTAALQRCMAITEIKSCSRQLADCAVKLHHTHTGNNLSHFTVISTGVHVNSATDAAWNTYSKFHATKAQLCSLAGSNSQGNTTAKGQRAIVNSNVIEHITKLDNQATDALIAHQQIRTVTNQRNRHFRLTGTLQQLLQLLLALRHSHQIGRTADAEGCMLRHRLLCQQRLGSTACENLLQRHYFSPIASLTTS